jgi:hypothetical protein
MRTSGRSVWVDSPAHVSVVSMENQCELSLVDERARGDEVRDIDTGVGCKLARDG